MTSHVTCRIIRMYIYIVRTFDVSKTIHHRAGKHRYSPICALSMLIAQLMSIYLYTKKNAYGFWSCTVSMTFSSVHYHFGLKDARLLPRKVKVNFNCVPLKPTSAKMIGADDSSRRTPPTGPAHGSNSDYHAIVRSVYMVTVTQ